MVIKHPAPGRTRSLLNLAAGAVLLVALSGGTTFGAQAEFLHAGSPNAPLLFCVGLHIEPLGARMSSLAFEADLLASPGLPWLAGGQLSNPGQDYNDPQFFLLHLGYITSLINIIENHSGKLTIQAQTPFTRLAATLNIPLFAGAAVQGHEIALHFHEESHLGNDCNTLPQSIWVAVMREEIDWIRAAGGRDIRYWSGGNLYPHILEAAAGVGLEVMSDYKNPKTQKSDPRLLAVNPWRPAGGPTADNLDDFVRHDPSGKIIYLPDGVFAGDDFRERKAEGEAAYFAYMTDGLDRSLRAARRDRVNVFHLTVHPGEFRGANRQEPFAVVDRWLSEVVDPLVRDGRVRWATFSEMADAFRAWERSHPGTDPRK